MSIHLAAQPQWRSQDLNVGKGKSGVGKGGKAWDGKIKVFRCIFGIILNN